VPDRPENSAFKLLSSPPMRTRCDVMVTNGKFAMRRYHLRRSNSGSFAMLTAIRRASSEAAESLSGSFGFAIQGWRSSGADSQRSRL